MGRYVLVAGVLAAACCGAAQAASVSVSQDTARNVVTVIQQKNPIINIQRDVTVSNGRSTVTEITQIGPGEPVPVQVRQSGSNNLLRSVQQGRNPTIEVQQDGTVNRAVVHQGMIP